MTRAEITACFEQYGALLQGHFQLRSGRHSKQFFQAALVLQHPAAAARLCRELVEPFQGRNVATVLSPALGGLIVGHEAARALGTRAIFAEKTDTGLVLRRGFKLTAGERVLIVEDVITRGGRVDQTIAVARACGAEPLGVAVLVDRSDGREFGVPLHSLIQLQLETYAPEACPLCRDGVSLTAPGSK